LGRSGKDKLLLLVVSDFDPEGDDIPESFAKLMRDDFGIDNVEAIKVALTYQQSPKLGIAETVIETEVPALLDDETIRDVGRLLDHRKKRVRRPPVRDHFYLLSGRIYCARCGYALSGQARSRGGLLLYRHCYSAKRRERKCPLGRPEPWLRAEEIERAVVRDLLSLLGNPAALERAVRAALPAPPPRSRAGTTSKAGWPR
jgi:hypothetical protein